MTDEKINEMWTKLNETKLTGVKAAKWLKKVLTKEENEAYTKEALEYMKAHPECLENPRKFDKAMNTMLLKYAESHKFADAKKLMERIIAYVEKVVEENGLEMPEIEFDATKNKMNKQRIQFSAIMLLYKNEHTEEEFFYYVAYEVMRVFGKLYKIELSATDEELIAFFNNEVEETEENDDDDDDDDKGMGFEDLDGEEEIVTDEIASIKGVQMLVHSYDEKWGTFRRIFKFDNMYYYNEDGEIVEYGSGMYTVSKSKSGLYASLKIGNKPFAISPEDAKSLFGWAQLHVNDLAIKKMAKEVNKSEEEVRKIWQDNLLDGWNFDNRLEYEEFRDFYVL